MPAWPRGEDLHPRAPDGTRRRSSPIGPDGVARRSRAPPRDDLGPMSWSTFVALGDSFTEGVGDPDPRTGTERGLGRPCRGGASRPPPPTCATRTSPSAASCSTRSWPTQVRARARDGPGPGQHLRRGQRPAPPVGAAGRPRPPVRGGGRAGSATRAPTCSSSPASTPAATPVVDLVGRRLATMNEHIREIAARRGARLVDLWTMETLADPRARAEDRLHLNADGHRRVAARVCEVLGVPPDDDWRDPVAARGPAAVGPPPRGGPALGAGPPACRGWAAAAGPQHRGRAPAEAPGARPRCAECQRSRLRHDAV